MIEMKSATRPFNQGINGSSSQRAVRADLCCAIVGGWHRERMPNIRFQPDGKVMCRPRSMSRIQLNEPKCEMV